MSKFSIATAAAVLVAAGVGNASGAIVFQDDFESGLGNWTQGASPHTLDTTRNQVPAGAGQSAYVDSSADRMFNNIVGDGPLGAGVELTGPSTFSYWLYDPILGGTTSTRMFGEVQSRAGDGIDDGTTSTTEALEQLLAIGKYNSVTTGTFDANKYQARVAIGGLGWFNLDGPGSPDRSVGWHEFTIERVDDDTLNFYVDSILSRTVDGVAVGQGWDTLAFGLGAGTTATDANYDGIMVTNTLVPEPASLALLGLAAFGLRRRRR